ncbi:MAG: hypothetical protein NWE93_12280 [Candidatus Bathyarchaeota archaeon]|nr:hypothetical protein [Candidatus Bathyarchaeota archaeon]
MASKRAKLTLTVILFLFAFAVAALWVFYQVPKSAPDAHRFNLKVYPSNATIMQAQNTTIKVDVTYLDGTSEPVTLQASGGPNGTLYLFSSQTGTPNATEPFSSNLTILLPAYAASDAYAINVSAASGSKTVQATFTLNVVSSQIQVSGTVSGTPIALAGYAKEDIIPTEIVFENTQTNQTYHSKVQRATDTPQRPGTVGNYTISLPNQQSYRVTIYYFSFPHFIPVARTAYVGDQRGHFAVDCGAGIEAVVADFKG